MTDDAATILVVEDDDATRAFLADNLTADGYDLLVADSARDGARLLETSSPTCWCWTSGSRTPPGSTSCAASATPTGWPAASTRGPRCSSSRGGPRNSTGCAASSEGPRLGVHSAHVRQRRQPPCVCRLRAGVEA